MQGLISIRGSDRYPIFSTLDSEKLGERLSAVKKKNNFTLLRKYDRSLSKALALNHACFIIHPTCASPCSDSSESSKLSRVIAPHRTVRGAADFRGAGNPRLIISYELFKGQKSSVEKRPHRKPGFFDFLLSILGQNLPTGFEPLSARARPIGGVPPLALAGFGQEPSGSLSPPMAPEGIPSGTSR